MLDSAKTAHPKIPLTVVGGFLGSGKTTLLNNILRTADGRRVAVLVNDFGPINIDAQLIAKHDGETISLTNGCICCSMGSGLDAALIQVLGMSPKPDWIVIEASGVSDPGPIANVGLTEPELSLVAVVTVLDAEHIASQANDTLLHDTVASQIQGADLLVLNKKDLLTADQLSGRAAFIREQFGDIPIFETTQGAVPMALLLPVEGESAFADARGTQGRIPKDQTAAHPFQTILWEGDGILSADALMMYFRALPRGVFRAKGIVHTDYHGRVAIQFAGRRLQFLPMTSAVPPTHDNQIVFIGAHGIVDDHVLFKKLDELA